MMAPIVPHLSEELYENMDGPKKSSVFLETWKPDVSPGGSGTSANCTSNHG